MIEQKRKEIDGTVYLVTQMNGIKALKIQTKLVSILGMSVVDILTKPGLGNVTDVSQKVILDNIGLLVENFDDEKVNSLVLSLFESGVFIETTVKEGEKVGQKIPTPLNFETHFAGSPMEMWKVVGFILEANFMPGESVEMLSSNTT